MRPLVALAAAVVAACPTLARGRPMSAVPGMGDPPPATSPSASAAPLPDRPPATETALVGGCHTLFGRAERVGKDELFGRDPGDPLAGRTVEVGKLSVGYSYTLPLARDLAVDLGALVSRHDLPGALEPAYGRDPTSLILFARVELR